MNMMKLMKQAQEMQAKAAKLQTELAARQYEAEAAGGQIKAVATGEGQLVSLKIDPALLKEGDAEMLEDLIVTAVREAIEKGKADAAKELGKIMPAGLGGGLPGFYSPARRLGANGMIFRIIFALAVVAFVLPFGLWLGYKGTLSAVE